ncbi:hypothetical protein WG66_005645 [Moniliophthora roreri]|nr:hypothetical protein WG66_005645 [Moniliophthora roreri]
MNVPSAFNIWIQAYAELYSIYFTINFVPFLVQGSREIWVKIVHWQRLGVVLIPLVPLASDDDQTARIQNHI